MSRAISRWILLLTAFWVLGPAAAYLVTLRHAPNGGSDVSILITDSLTASIGTALVSLLLAIGAGLVGSRLFGTRTGLFAAGLVLVWPAWAAGSMNGIVRHAPSGSTFRLLAVEGLMLGLAAAAVAIMIAKVYRHPADGSNSGGKQPKSAGSGARLMPALPIALGVAVVAALAVARTELPGQTIAAAFAAGLLGAMAAAIVEPRLNPGVLLACLVALACIGPASAAVVEGDGSVRRFYAGTIMPMARITPMHWVAGLMLGVPVGASWASGFQRKPQES